MSPGVAGRAGSRLREWLDQLADVLVLGLAVTVCAAGVVTVLAGLAAAAHVLQEPDDERPVLLRFRSAWRQHWRRAMKLQVLWSALVVVGAVDLLTLSPMSLRPMVTGVGVILLLGAAVLPPFLAAALVQDGRRGAGSLRGVVLVAVIAAVGHPMQTFAVLALGVLTVGVAVAAAAALPVLGVFAVLALRLTGLSVSGVRLEAVEPSGVRPT